MRMQENYTVRSLFPGVTGIEERGVNCYLVTGDERALLIDTGWGFGDLAGLVASLTSLPVTVVNTHGHPDHVNGDAQFPEVMISAADLPIALRTASPEARRAMYERVSSRAPLPEGFSPEAWINTPLPTLQPLPENTIFDLGDRTLQVISTPGHQPGAICLLDAGARLLFTGDTIVAGPILMFLDNALSLQTYADSLQRLLTHIAEIDYLLPGHGNEPLPSARVAELHQAALAIINGEVTGELEHTYFGDTCCARFDTCAICYNPDRLH